MKKTASLILVSILAITVFYNVIGYRMLSAFEQEQEWVTSMKQIPDSEFKVINLNASLYTFLDDTEMEFVNENIVINKKTYHIFKKRIQNNLLKLYYLPNINSDLSSQEIDHLIAGQLFNFSNENNNSSKKITKTFVIDYFIEYPQSFTYISKQFIISTSLNSVFNENLLSGYGACFYSPPDFI